MNAETDIIGAKKRLRAVMKSARDQAAARMGPEAAARLAAHSIDFAGVTPPACVSGFLPIGAEIDPLPLMSRLHSEGYALALPVMVAKGVPLEFRAWAPGEPLAEVTWGIREPLATAQVVEPDVVLGPLLAFDAEGFRLGYGGGFYDRTLARLRAAKPVVAIGLAFDEQRVDEVPRTTYDEPLDWVLTPSGPVRCGR
jgi:5-formyltetrahydrofolate cyclo-ligase